MVDGLMMMRARQPRVVLHAHMLVNTVSEFTAGREHYFMRERMTWRAYVAQRVRSDCIILDYLGAGGNTGGGPAPHGRAPMHDELPLMVVCLA